jgi:hypothetical protein
LPEAANFAALFESLLSLTRLEESSRITLGGLFVGLHALAVAPPHTVASLKSRIMKAEGFIGHQLQLFGDVDGDVLMNDNDHIHILAQKQTFLGHIAHEPIMVI